MSDTRPWWPVEFGSDTPAFRVQRELYGLVTGGDYVRGSSVTTLPHTALRYRSQDPEVFEAVGKALLFVRPFDHFTIEILWSWPNTIADTWLEVALVRSAFGEPSTPQDGQTVFRSMRADFDTIETDTGTQVAAPPIVYDQPLPSGRWYYYTLFFRMNPLDWVATMSNACLLPRDYHHAEYMWDAVPPFYQWTDDNIRVGSGFLRQFLTIFGFELDTTRGFVDSLADLHHTDFAPMALLKHLGANYGIPYEAGIGDIRYRGLISVISNLQQIRGTAKGLEQMVEAVSKYECDVTGSSNEMLLSDDSDFYYGSGNWGAIHPDTPTSLITGS